MCMSVKMSSGSGNVQPMDNGQVSGPEDNGQVSGEVSGEQPVQQLEVQIAEPNQLADVHFENPPQNVPDTTKETSVADPAIVRYNNLIDDIRPHEDKNYDRNSYQGQFQMIYDAAAGLCQKFVTSDIGEWETAALDWCLDDKSERDEIKKLVADIKNLRMTLVQHITNELQKAHDRMLQLQPNTVEYVTAMQESLSGIGSALRNFRYRYDRHNSLMTNYSHCKRAIGQFFSNSRLKHDTEAAGQFNDLSLLERRLRRLSGMSDPDNSVLRAFSEDSHSISEAIRNIDQSVSKRSYAFELAKSQIMDLANHGGEKTIDVSLAAGFGFNIGVFDAKAMVKGHHYYRIHSDGSGAVTIEHLNQYGAAFRATGGLSNTLKLDVGAEVGGGFKAGNSSETFKDVDSAALYMTDDWLKYFNPLVDYGGAGKITMKVLKAVSKPFCWLGRHIAKAVCDTTLGKNYKDMGGEEGFVKRMTERKILGKIAERTMPGANVLKVGDREFGFVKGGGEAVLNMGTGFANLQFGVSEDMEYQRAAVRTDYKPYMAMLEDELHGTVTDSVKKEFTQDYSPDHMGKIADLLFVDTGENRTLISDLVTKPESRTAGGILKALKGLKKGMDNFARSQGGDAHETGRAAARYRATARVAAALFEMWEKLLAKDVSAQERTDYGQLSATVRSQVTNPAVEFPPDVLKRELMVSRTDRDNVFINRTTFSLVYDAFARHSYNVMSSNETLSGGKFGNRLARAGAEGGLAGAERVGGLLQNSLEVEFVTHKPVTRHRRQWQNTSRTEINLRFGPDSPVIDGILWAIGKAVTAGKGVDGPMSSTDLSNYAVKILGDPVVAALKRLCVSDFMSNKSLGSDVGSALVDAQGKSLNVNAQSILGRMNLVGGRNVQLVMEDNRLTGISFGDHFKMDFRVDLGEVVMFEGEFKMNSVTNRVHYALEPSFNSLLSKCDGMTRYGNQSHWAMFATKQRGALSRMYDVIRDGIQKGPDAERKNRKDREDVRQFYSLIETMAEDFNKKDRMEGIRLEAFQKNFTAIDKLLEEIKATDDKSDPDQFVKADRMQALLECITRHFNLVDMDMSSGEVRDPDLIQFRDFAEMYDNSRFTIARFGVPLPGGGYGVDVSEGDHVLMPLFRTPQMKEQNNITRITLLKAIVHELHPEKDVSALVQGMEFEKLLKMIPKSIRRKIKPENFDGTGKPLTAYRVGRILDALAEYRREQRLGLKPLQSEDQPQPDLGDVNAIKV